MKEKIEITQADMLGILVEKINFLMKEYQNLHSAFEYKGRGKVSTDPLKVSESYEKFLTEKGDIERLLSFYKMFDVMDKQKKRAGDGN